MGCAFILLISRSTIILRRSVIKSVVFLLYASTLLVSPVRSANATDIVVIWRFKLHCARSVHFVVCHSVFIETWVSELLVSHTSSTIDSPCAYLRSYIRCWNIFLLHGSSVTFMVILCIFLTCRHFYWVFNLCIRSQVVQILWKKALCRAMMIRWYRCL